MMIDEFALSGVEGCVAVDGAANGQRTARRTRIVAGKADRLCRPWRRVRTASASSVLIYDGESVDSNHDRLAGIEKWFITKEMRRKELFVHLVNEVLHGDVVLCSIQSAPIYGYAARLVSARLIHLAISAEPAPMVNRDLMRRSRETELSPASILPTRDWLDPSRAASAVCESPPFSLSSFRAAASASFGTYCASTS